MHQTTIRFSSDNWAGLEREAARLGVSAAQYIREAALMRIMYTAGRRGDREMDDALKKAAGSEPFLERRDRAIEHAHEELESSEALWSQGRIARERARILREESLERRRATTT
jgi:aminopeptidase N